MYKQKLGISVGGDYGVPMKEVLEMIKSAGFDAVSPEWVDESSLEELTNDARALGLEIQSLHAPYRIAAKMWSADGKYPLLRIDRLVLVAESRYRGRNSVRKARR